MKKYIKLKNKKCLKIVKNSITLIFSTILFIIFTYLINYIFQLFILKRDFPYFFDITHVRVEGTSMLPTIKSNSLLLVIKTNDLKVNDIVCFRDECGCFVVHRIVEIENETIITKGDNNADSDNPINLDAVLGKVLFVK